VDALQLPERFRGRPDVVPSLCKEGCRACADACPTEAIQLHPLRIDLGACLFCGACQDACPTGAIRFTNDHRLSVRSREDLVLEGKELPLALSLDARMRRLFGRSLKLRQVSAGGCNGCEAELVALGNVVFDLGRFGIQFVASPRHADGIVVTGPVTENMEAALRETYAAVPSPRIVIAVGACAISGGPFAGSEAARGSLPPDIPVDLYIAGCPPHPLTVLDGLLRLVGQLERRDARRHVEEDIRAETLAWGTRRANAELRGVDAGKGSPGRPSRGNGKAT
jgi:Ni,Fe-hydrogenase III small subunit/NAD-dependent dihydropyrimidine dehydrogenase PreA subunit